MRLLLGVTLLLAAATTVLAADVTFHSHLTACEPKNRRTVTWTFVGDAGAPPFAVTRSRCGTREPSTLGYTGFTKCKCEPLLEGGMRVYPTECYAILEWDDPFTGYDRTCGGTFRFPNGSIGFLGFPPEPE